MTENVMQICGLSMEMEIAREMGYIGKCIGCLYLERRLEENRIICSKKGVIRQRDNCKDWIVDHR